MEKLKPLVSPASPEMPAVMVSPHESCSSVASPHTKVTVGCRLSLLLITASQACTVEDIGHTELLSPTLLAVLLCGGVPFWKHLRESLSWVALLLPNPEV